LPQDLRVLRSDEGVRSFLRLNEMPGSDALLDMFAAIRERCARIMREGGAIPETS
jgi:hypothetical protein